MNIHGHGFVRLDGAMADDISVVNSARVSFGKKISELSEADVGLIKFLMREKHGTPFEHNAFRFHVSCPIFVAREWFRHRIGSFNEFSSRYTEMQTVGYVPELSHMRSQTGKPGAYSFVPMELSEADLAREEIETAYKASYEAYSKLLDSGVAKELARMVLPVGTFTEFYWTVNARSLMNFLSLRLHENAQKEIREYAALVEIFFAEQMPVTWAAWVSEKRICP